MKVSVVDESTGFVDYEEGENSPSTPDMSVRLEGETGHKITHGSYILEVKRPS